MPRLSKLPRLMLPALTLLMTLAGCDAPPPKVTVASRGPTVVFEAGLGNGAEVWDGVSLPAGLGRFAWTRAGYGLGAELLVGRAWPGDGDGRRSGTEVAAELEAALRDAGAAPPYILVGHSIGALYALQYAMDHPERVAGLVLVDPRLPGFTDRCRAAGLGGCEVPALLRLSLSDAERLELDGVPETEAALADLGRIRHIPLSLLVATRPGLGEDPRWRGLWRSHAEGFAAGFAEARVISVDSGHFIQTTAPAVGAAEVARLAR